MLMLVYFALGVWALTSILNLQFCGCLSGQAFFLTSRSTLRPGPFLRSFRHTNTTCKPMGPGWQAPWKRSKGWSWSSPSGRNLNFCHSIIVYQEAQTCQMSNHAKLLFIFYDSAYFSFFSSSVFFFFSCPDSVGWSPLAEGNIPTFSIHQIGHPTVSWQLVRAWTRAPTSVLSKDTMAL